MNRFLKAVLLGALLSSAAGLPTPWTGAALAREVPDEYSETEMDLVEERSDGRVWRVVRVQEDGLSWYEAEDALGNRAFIVQLWPGGGVVDFVDSRGPGVVYWR